MKKIFISKLFLILTPIILFLIGVGAGVLLGFQPSVSGSVSGWSSLYGGSTSGSTSTEFVFRIETAVGYWLLAFIISVVALLLCVMIRNYYLDRAEKEKVAPSENTTK